MTRRSEQLSDELQNYLVAHTTPIDEVLSQLAAETARRFPDASGMQIGPEQGVFMTMLTQLIGASRALEIGTFTGYSSICIARGLAAGGSLICGDVSDEWTSVAREYWQRANVADRRGLLGKRASPHSRRSGAPNSSAARTACCRPKDLQPRWER